MLTAATRRTIDGQQSLWSRRAVSWDHHAGNNAGLQLIAAAVLRCSDPAGHMHVLDLGCGSGQLSLPVAEQVAWVTAVDVSPVMCDLLQDKAAAAGVTNISTQTAAMQELSLPPASYDLVISNYAMHHVLDSDKPAVVRAVSSWLRPGGRLVIGDMMLGRGTSAEDRRVIAAKVAAMARRGPAGWWRIAKNAVRYLLRLREWPVSTDRWQAMLTDAGFVDVRVERIVGEAAIVTGVRPPAPSE